VLGMWMVKDSAANCPYIFKYKSSSGDFYYHENSTYVTNSVGSSATVPFSLNEILKGYDYGQKIMAKTKDDQHEIVFEGDFVPAAKSTTLHNNLDKFK